MRGFEMMTDVNWLGWQHVVTGLILVLLLILQVRRVRHKKRRIAEEEEWTNTCSYPSEELDTDAIADSLLKSQSQNAKVSLFDFETNLYHEVLVTDEIIRRARAGGFRCIHHTTADSGAIHLIPKTDFEEVEENVVPEETESMELTGPLHLPGREERPALEVHRGEGSFWDCLGEIKQKKGKVQVISAFEWAEILMSGESDKGMLNTWIGEGIVFLPEGDALIVDRAQSPVFSCTMCGENDMFIARSDKKLKRLVKSASRNPDQAIQSGILLLRREQWDRTLNPQKTMKLEPEDFSKHPVAVFLFRDSVQRFAAHLGGHNITFSISLETDFGDLDYMLARTTVSAAFLGAPHVVQARVEPLHISGALKQTYGLISLGSGWGWRYLHMERQ
jgi:hypothetical protein